MATHSFDLGFGEGLSSKPTSSVTKDGSRPRLLLTSLISSATASTRAVSGRTYLAVRQTSVTDKILQSAATTTDTISDLS